MILLPPKHTDTHTHTKKEKGNVRDGGPRPVSSCDCKSAINKNRKCRENK